MSTHQFLMFLIVLISSAHHANCLPPISKERIQYVAEICCREVERKCCVDMIRFGSPIGCGIENYPRYAHFIYTCIQDVMFKKQEELKVKLDDTTCCQVFMNDQNDPNRKCESVCKRTMMAPSLDLDTRLGKIERCTIAENPLFECFNRCRELRTEGIRIEDLHFQEYCNASYISTDPRFPVFIDEYNLPENFV